MSRSRFSLRWLIVLMICSPLIVGGPLSDSKVLLGAVPILAVVAFVSALGVSCWKSEPSPFITGFTKGCVLFVLLNLVTIGLPIRLAGDLVLELRSAAGIATKSSEAMRIYITTGSSLFLLFGYAFGAADNWNRTTQEQFAAAKEIS